MIPDSANSPSRLCAVIHTSGRGAQIIDCLLPKKGTWSNPAEPKWLTANEDRRSRRLALDVRESARRVCSALNCLHYAHHPFSRCLPNRALLGHAGGYFFLCRREVRRYAKFSILKVILGVCFDLDLYGSRGILSSQLRLCRYLLSLPYSLREGIRSFGDDDRYPVTQFVVGKFVAHDPNR